MTNLDLSTKKDIMEIYLQTSRLPMKLIRCRKDVVVFSMYVDLENSILSDDSMRIDIELNEYIYDKILFAICHFTGTYNSRIKLLELLNRINERCSFLKFSMNPSNDIYCDLVITDYNFNPNNIEYLLNFGFDVIMQNYYNDIVDFIAYKEPLFEI